MRHLFLITLFITFCTQVVAKESVTHLEQVSIQGKALDLNSNSYGFFKREDFIGQFSTLSEFLKQSTSVQVRYNGVGNSPKLSIRGSKHDQIQFMIDGQIIENAQYGGFNIDQIPLNQIESIELVKGIHSNIAQQAIGGVIKITRTTIQKNTHDIAVNIGEFNNRQISSSHAYPFLGQVLLGLDLEKSKNDYNTNITSPKGDSNNKDQIQPLNNNDLQKYYGHIRWISDIDFSNKITISHETNHKKKGIPDYFSNNSDNAALYEQKSDKTRLSYDYIYSPHTQIKSNVFYEKNEDYYSDISKASSLDSEETIYKYRKIQLSQSLYREINNLEWGVNFNYEFQDYEDNHLLVDNSTKCTSTFSKCDINSERIVSRYTFNTTYKLNDTIELLGNISNNRSTYNSTQIQTSIISKESDRNYTQWGLAINTLINKGNVFRLNINQAYRLPTLFELYGDLGAIKGSPALKPEKAINFSADYSFISDVKLDFSLFYRVVTDSIIANYNSQGIGSYDNAQSSELMGAEIELKYEFSDLNIIANFTTQDSNTTSTTSSLDNVNLPGVYHNSLSIEFLLMLNLNHQITIQSFIDTGLYLDTTNTLKGSDRNLSNLKYRYLKENYSLQISINNLFDQTYSDQSNHQAPNRNLTLLTTLSF